MSHSSYAANQSKTEPHPPGAGEGQTETPGADNPQAPSPGAGDQTGLGSDAAPGTSEELEPVQGLHVPDVPETDPRT
ncbi:MAG: hypothetical protein JWN31_956 [Frankiales bacterium]|nr:hypothetical protein [Frankiales bacterium]